MSDFPIVGIGSSAGGLEALQTLFRAMPEDCGLAFVVAAHLDPTQKSHLAELLARCTKMPVQQIEDGPKVAPNHVYVIAPDTELSIKKGVLKAHQPTAPRGHRHPVDYFFRALAEDQGERAIAIVLSGTGTNGSLGLRFIKAEGGVAIAQDPETAAFQGMPRSAIGTGIVDLVLPPEKMPDALLGLARHAYVREPAAALEKASSEDQLQALLASLRAQTHRDFSGYKHRTLLRRIHRRMGLHRIGDLSAYTERLRTDAGELKALVADLTINVTGFFRDPEAWETLTKEVIAPLVAERPTDAAIRVWVPGCSTGEEAYSIAILLAEQAEAVGKFFDIRLFATDVADGVLSTARAGQYPGSIALDIGEERLERFFEPQDDTYCIGKTLREMITFAPQNLLQDPPFSRLDLISCRNLLIYLQPEAQKRALGLFHFALREGGHLFLGSAETTSTQEDLFQPIDKKWRIYRRIGSTRHDLVDFPLMAGHARHDGGEAVVPADPQTKPNDLLLQALAERFAPASALIDARARIHYLRGPVEDYLRPAAGEPSHSLFAMARDGLQTPLRTAVHQALDQGQEVMAQGQVRRGGELHPVRLIVTPVRSGRQMSGKLMVSFFERDHAGDDRASALPAAVPAELPAPSELETAREDLRISVEHAEAANEELKASNEEIRSINEELQASNEELETSKEELQSLNEELNTVNNQLQAKVGELEERTNDLNNLLNSTDIATLFLDRQLCIRWFTPAMKALFELLPSDIDRPITNFAQRFSGGALVEDARTVLARLVPIDAEVESDRGRWYIRHMLPYCTEDDRILGVAVTFTDITERKRAEEALRDSEKRLAMALEAMGAGVYEHAVPAGEESFYSQRWTEILGLRQKDLPPHDAFHAWFAERIHPDDRAMFEQTYNAFIAGDDGSYRSEYRFRHGDGDWRWIEGFAQALERDAAGEVRRLVGVILDVTESRQATEERELLARELSHRVKNTLAVVQALARQTDGRIATIEEYREVFLGRLQAMAKAHNHLIEANWRRADLKRLIEQAVAAYCVDHPELVEIKGKRVILTPKQGLGLSLILHELGTNAAKYGALSHHDGRLRIAWEVENAEQKHRVRLTWTERDGPEVVPPDSRGFGTRLIEQASGYELDGEAELRYAPEGFSCALVFPLEVRDER